MGITGSEDNETHDDGNCSEQANICVDLAGVRG